MRIEVAGYGDMVFQLFEQRAPRPTERVIELADSGFYDGIIFHRVIEGFVIQGGDPTGTGSGGSTLGTFDDQYHVDLQHNQAGTAVLCEVVGRHERFAVLRDFGPDQASGLQSFDLRHSGRRQGCPASDRQHGDRTGDRPIYEVQMNTVEIFQDTENAVMMLKADPAAIGQQANDHGHGPTARAIRSRRPSK
jgi:large repetitive protein